MRDVLPLVAGLLLVVALLAGCSSAPTPSAPLPTASPSPAYADPLTPRPELATPTARPPVTLGVPGAAEPNLAVAPDGTLYASNPCEVWRSDDGGKAWKETAHKGQDGCGDGDLAVGSQGQVFWLGLFGKDTAVPFQVSTDRGESFGAAYDVSAKDGKTQGTGSDREWIDVVPLATHDVIATTWRGAGVLESRVSLDGGNSWEAKAKVGEDGDEGPVTHDAVTGQLYIPVVDQAATAGLDKPTVRVHTSTDFGKTWSQSTVTTFPRSSPVEPNGYASDFPTMAVDSNGTVYIAYSGDASAYAEGVTPPEEAAIYGIYLAASHDHGKTWSVPQLISDPQHDARFPWIVAGLPGRVAVTWYESVHRIPGEAVPDQWNVRLWESMTADGSNPKSVTVTLTPTPNHTGSVCTSGTGCAAADRSLLDYFEMAIDPSGQPIVVWASSTLGTGVGVAVQSTSVVFGGIATGTPLR
jgi:hypothetical protein